LGTIVNNFITTDGAEQPKSKPSRYAMLRKTKLTITIPLAIAVPMAVCSAVYTVSDHGHLSRRNAATQLDGAAKFPYAGKEMLFHVGTMGSCNPFGGFNPETDVDTSILTVGGYISVRKIKAGLWDVELTDLGTKSINQQQRKYGHARHGDCDYWQVSLPLSEYDHLEVTGVVESGSFSKADFTVLGHLTQAGMDVKKIAPTVLPEVERKQFKRDDEFVKSMIDSDSDEILGIPYRKASTATFLKYDDGWKLTGIN
jgi:hypothetical protein